MIGSSLGRLLLNAAVSSGDLCLGGTLEDMVTGSIRFNLASVVCCGACYCMLALI